MRKTDRTWHAVLFRDEEYLADERVEVGYSPKGTLDVLEAVRFPSEGAAKTWVRENNYTKTAEVVLVSVIVEPRRTRGQERA